MTHLVLIALMAGAATAFSTEVIGTVSDFWIFDPARVKAWTTVPFAALFCWLLGLQQLDLVVPVLAASFVSLAVMRWLNRPVQVQQVVQRRVP